MVCYFKPEGIEKHHAGREDMHWQFAELRDRFLGRKYQPSVATSSKSPRGTRSSTRR